MLDLRKDFFEKSEPFWQ